MAWMLNVHESRKVEAVEMSCLRCICGVRRMDRISNVEIRRRCGKTVGVGERMDQGVLRWFGHVERMEEEAMRKKDKKGRRLKKEEKVVKKKRKKDMEEK